MRIKFLLFSASTTLLLWAAACARNPVTGERQLALISTAQEIEMGRQSHPEILAEYGRVQNQELQNYFNGVGQKIAKISHRPDLPWTFTVVDSPVVNAFAVPGGFIYLTRGILAYMNNEAEMAGVLGHEIGHVTARHSVTQMSQQQLLGLGMGLGSVFSETFSKFGGLAETGAGILLLKYSRDHERQSDRIGLRYMAQAGYDPAQMSRFFEVFQGLREEKDAPLPNWLSSHPAPPERIQNTASEAREIRNETPGKTFNVRTDAFLSHIENLVYGKNPREGFADKNRFYHPDLRFRMEFPDGWTVQNAKSFVAFLQPEGKAAIELRIVPPDKASTPEGAGVAIAQQSGITQYSGSGLSIHGNRSYLGRYRLQSDSGTIDILAGFIDYGGNLYQIAGMAPVSTYPTYADPLESVIRSFRKLDDQRVLSVQPDRLRIYRTRGN
ncbi:MAG: M48 family metalloprotease, partial [Acidobacteriota bacterium]